MATSIKIPDNIHLLYLPSSNPDRTADAAKAYRTILARNEKTGGFQKLLDEAELEEWIKQTIQTFTHEQVSSLTAYPYIKQACQSAMAYA